MSFDQLKNYVTTQRLSGVPDEKIASSLREKHWHEALITKALKDDANAPGPTPGELDLGSRLLSVGELVPAAWDLFTKNARAYIFTSLAMIFTILATLAIFIAPIIYDVVGLHFTVNDFLSTSVLPVVILHTTLGILTLILVSLWGTLALYTIVAHDGKMTVNQAFKRAWERLPGFTLIGIYSALITLAGFVVFFIPGLIFSIYLTFASLAYVVHGSRGKSALLSSLALVQGRWWKTFWRLLAAGILSYLASIIASSIIPVFGAIAAKVVLSPLMLIYVYIVYQNYMAFDKAHPKEELVDTKHIAAEVADAEK